MPDYLRNRVPGETYFFAVNLLEHRRSLLTDHIEALRVVVRRTRVRHPFHIDAWVVLPDHLHWVWTLPPGDTDYSVRWKAIKIVFAIDAGIYPAGWGGGVSVESSYGERLHRTPMRRKALRFSALR